MSSEVSCCRQSEANRKLRKTLTFDHVNWTWLCLISACHHFQLRQSLSPCTAEVLADNLNEWTGIGTPGRGALPPANADKSRLSQSMCNAKSRPTLNEGHKMKVQRQSTINLTSSRKSVVLSASMGGINWQQDARGTQSFASWMTAVLSVPQISKTCQPERVSDSVKDGDWPVRDEHHIQWENSWLRRGRWHPGEDDSRRGPVSLPALVLCFDACHTT